MPFCCSEGRARLVVVARGAVVGGCFLVLRLLFFPIVSSYLLCDNDNADRYIFLMHTDLDAIFEFSIDSILFPVQNLLNPTQTALRSRHCKDSFIPA